MQKDNGGESEIKITETIITASFTGKISTGQFENASPFFSCSEKYNAYLSDENIKSRQAELHNICYEQFNILSERFYAERIAKEYQNIRFYDANGTKYPSVTSIIGMDEDFRIPPDELEQYGCRGTIIHKQVEIFLETGEWKAPQDIADISAEYLTVKKGSLKLDLEGYNFVDFYKEYPFKFLELETQVFNHEHKYAGRRDILCVIESSNKGKWDKVEGVKFDVKTILDVKTNGTLDQIKGLKQQSAYAKCDGVEQIGLIHLNADNKCGYAKPIITTNIERYWNLFLSDREKFRKRYGI